MKKHNGFTLIELLAVIVILGLLIGVVTPVVTGILSTSEEDAYNSQIDTLIRAAKTWSLENSNYLPNITSVNIICTKKDTITNGNKAEGNYNYGDEYSCELGDGEEKTFYVLENNTDTVSLIMNMNIDLNGLGTTSKNRVAWVSTEDYIAAGGEINEEGCKYGGYCGTNEYGPVTALAYLSSSTESWSKLKEDQITIPTYDQIYIAAGNKASNLLTWLSENVEGYWTSTSGDGSDNAWAVDCENYALRSDFNVYDSGFFGIRPVITIYKNQIDNKLQNQDLNTLYLSLDKLVEDGIVEDDEIINPKTDEKMEGCISIKYIEEYKQYEYKFISDNNLCK